MFQQNNSDNNLGYVGFSSETISIIAEQFIHDTISEEVFVALAEDISYKMRELLNVNNLKHFLTTNNNKQ